jgi:hypothetical protein
MRYCTRCVQPDTRPGIVFDEEGVCPACRFAQEDPHVDWTARRAEREELCAFARRPNGSGYDGIVGVSGGKASTRQAVFIKEEMGLNPLLVCCSYPPEQLAERGARNLSNLVSLGFDCLTVQPAPGTWKTLMREGFRRFGNWAKSTEMALYTSAPKAAIAYQIPVIFLGENPAITAGALEVGSTTGSRWSTWATTSRASPSGRTRPSPWRAGWRSARTPRRTSATSPGTRPWTRTSWW